MNLYCTISDGGPFEWQGAGQSVFGSSPGKAGGGGNEEDDDVEKEPDVYFEPIVQLPEVQVMTGEEEEQVRSCRSFDWMRVVTRVLIGGRRGGKVVTEVLIG